MTRILVIDNYDSFVYTLNGYLMELGAETEVVRNDAFAPEDAREHRDAVLGEGEWHCSPTTVAARTCYFSLK